MSLSDVDVNDPIETHLSVTPAQNEAENLQRLANAVEQAWRQRMPMSVPSEAALFPGEPGAR